ncbi:TPA: trifunctional enzyme subunit alpha, mitochondrial [Bos taurus]|nr:TPA: trifunctional enzyme subunit alpha, mitochondrial [Bos taurus]
MRKMQKGLFYLIWVTDRNPIIFQKASLVLPLLRYICRSFTRSS